MTRQEALRIIIRVSTADGSESELDSLKKQLKAAFPRARIMDLIFYADQPRTPEQTLDEALRREAEPMIPLPAPAPSR